MSNQTYSFSIGDEYLFHTGIDTLHLKVIDHNEKDIVFYSPKSGMTVPIPIPAVISFINRKDFVKKVSDTIKIGHPLTKIFQ